MWELDWKLTAGQSWQRNSIFLVTHAPAHALNRACEQLSGRPPKYFRALEALIDILKTVISLMLNIMTLHDWRNLIHSKLLWNLFGNRYLWVASWYRLLILFLCFNATRNSIMWELHWKLTAGLTWESNSIVLVANGPAHALNRACDQLNGRPRK